MIFDKDSLEGQPFELFPKAMKEMFEHHETCENQECKENGWDKLKVIDVEYIGE